jgi:hypothetical protein
MLNKRNRPEVNAGSMADIAFLLLIFFLVTTTIQTDMGLQRKLPPIDPIKTGKPIHDRNLLTVELNAEDKLLVEGEYHSLAELKILALNFIDNNGKGDCLYCQGMNSTNSSDHPSKAVITIQNNRKTSYTAYVGVQNELAAAYNELRDREAEKRFALPFKKLTPPRQKEIKQLYPMIISEAQPLDLAAN